MGKEIMAPDFMGLAVYNYKGNVCALSKLAKCDRFLNNEPKSPQLISGSVQFSKALMRQIAHLR